METGAESKTQHSHRFTKVAELPRWLEGGELPAHPATYRHAVRASASIDTDVGAQRK